MLNRLSNLVRNGTESCELETDLVRFKEILRHLEQNRSKYTKPDEVLILRDAFTIIARYCPRIPDNFLTLSDEEVPISIYWTQSLETILKTLQSLMTDFHDDDDFSNIVNKIIATVDLMDNMRESQGTPRFVFES